MFLKNFDPRELSVPAHGLYMFMTIVWPIRAKFYVQPTWKGET